MKKILITMAIFVMSICFFGFNNEKAYAEEILLADGGEITAYLETAQCIGIPSHFTAKLIIHDNVEYKVGYIYITFLVNKNGSVTTWVEDDNNAFFVMNKAEYPTYWKAYYLGRDYARL